MHIEIGQKYVITSNRWAFQLCIKAVVMGEDTLIPISQDMSLAYIIRDCLMQELNDADIKTLEELRATVISTYEKIDVEYKQQTSKMKSLMAQSKENNNAR